MRFRQLAVLLMFCSLFTTAHAAPDADYPWEQKRAQFKEARKALAKGDTRKLNQLKPQLADYPLYAYIEYAQLASSLWKAKSSDIDRFLAAHADSPVSRRLRSHWLSYLQQQDKWQEFRRYYAANEANTEQQCYYQLANYRAGEQASALAAGLSLWQVGKSQPKACDPLFALLTKHQTITETAAWQRYTQAVLNHEYGLAEYLQRFFTTPTYQKSAAAYLQVDRTPYSIISGPVDSRDATETRDIMVHGITHLSVTHPQESLKAWEKFRQLMSFSADQQANMLSDIVKNLDQKNYQGKADDVLRQYSALIPVTAFESRLRTALANQDWPTVRFWITHLPEAAAQENRWQYWLARAETAMQISNGENATGIFNKLALERDYYGYLSAQRLSLPYQLNNKDAAADPASIAAVNNNEAMIRSRELYYVGEIVEAKREWAFAGSNFSRTEWMAAARLTADWGWSNRAIMGLIAAEFWDDTVLRFPLDYRSSYEAQGEKQRLSASTLAAITRQESAFDPWAVSGSDARGLMQLLPSTAKYIADKRKIRFGGTTELFEPAKNIELGSAYYRYLMDQFNDNRILSTAGYNAGPNRAKAWQANTKGKLPADIWIEIIPYRETRNYVMNVLTFAVIYSLKYGQPAELLTIAEQSQKL